MYIPKTLQELFLFCRISRFGRRQSILNHNQRSRNNSRTENYITVLETKLQCVKDEVNLQGRPRQPLNSYDVTTEQNSGGGGGITLDTPLYEKA